MMGLYAFYHLLDGNKGVACGVMRGLAKQYPAALVSALCYYPFSLPL